MKRQFSFAALVLHSPLVILLYISVKDAKGHMPSVEGATSIMSIKPTMYQGRITGVKLNLEMNVFGNDKIMGAIAAFVSQDAQKMDVHGVVPKTYRANGTINVMIKVTSPKAL
eukprot:CAMPEP_0206041962 /NCGR_PEP_ID=MMETSP1466-20131121/6272_1 /ASSEMBLY_ACC=CAM_ASM_001126 /TAXON_ID=44452 /ORGANISM="Pavlova gyrans, Strain CCMP608" /LENGTH=112 /DNA_ID=CAMNT_0053416667 /DNA_START=128 /DNA_END=461 /DNA_ORIENTATION=+